MPCRGRKWWFMSSSVPCYVRVGWFLILQHAVCQIVWLLGWWWQLFLGSSWCSSCILWRVLSMLVVMMLISLGDIVSAQFLVEFLGILCFTRICSWVVLLLDLVLDLVLGVLLMVRWNGRKLKVRMRWVVLDVFRFDSLRVLEGLIVVVLVCREIAIGAGTIEVKRSVMVLTRIYLVCL